MMNIKWLLKLFGKHEPRTLSTNIIAGVILFIITGVISFISIPLGNRIKRIFHGHSSSNLCIGTKPDKLFNETTTNTISYITIPVISKEISNVENQRSELTSTRIQVIIKALEKADSILAKSQYKPFCHELIPFVKALYDSTDLINLFTLKELFARDYLFINEYITQENNRCVYNLNLSVAKKGGETISGIIELVKNQVCIRQAINDKYIKILDKEGMVSISFRDVVTTLCDICPEVKKVKDLRKLCPDGFENCANLYFSSGNYELSLMSCLILKNLFEQLNKNSAYWVEFHGSTDAHPVTNTIKYSGNGNKSTNGILLPAKGNEYEEKIVNIQSNDDLAFARAFSCYEYVKNNFNTSGNSLNYTGHGINTEITSELQKRTVYIIIKKTHGTTNK